MNRRKQQGIALVVTLIMLSVITFLAIAFLVLSRRQRDAVTTTTDQTTARFSADSALERAKVELVSRMLAFTNKDSYDLIVSRAFVNEQGYNPNPLPPNGNRFTNVNFEYLNNGGALLLAQYEQNLINLYYNPRVPVYVTNEQLGVTESRHYLDLNRNGRYDTNGLRPVISDDPSNPYFNTNGVRIPNILPGQTLSNSFVGDPEWIGILERPELPHSSSNRFVARYAYMVLPAGKTLDVNYIHNQAATRAMDPLNDGFIRNQGVGPWEINLAAFLYDLNTNSYAWGGPAANPYRYLQANLPVPGFNSGVAFLNALSILSNRYNGTYTSLTPASQLFLNNALPLTSDDIDEYSDGTLMTGAAGIDEAAGIQDPVNQPWAGADNTNHFFSPFELLDPQKTSQDFVDRLDRASRTNSSYDRYTFYRLLAQLGTSSAAEPNDKMNVNFDNIVKVNANGARSPTNLFAWTPIDFFNNAANRMLSATFTNGATNINSIRIWPNNYYSASVHRLLQLAANMYDAVTNQYRLVSDYPHLPSVFRPVFRRDALGNVLIVGYQELRGEPPNFQQLFANGGPAMLDIDNPTDRASLQPAAGYPGNELTPDQEPMVYGVPVIIGAKKGFPNFNELAMQSMIRLTRKLQFLRQGNTSDGPIVQTNQMYVVEMAAQAGVEAWNSYSNAFPRAVRMLIDGDVTLVLTNEFGQIVSSNRMSFNSISTNIPIGWPGFTEDAVTLPSMKVPLAISNSVLAPSRWNAAGLPALLPLSPEFPLGQAFAVPRWWLNVSTRLRMSILDVSTAQARIIDYVNLVGKANTVDVTSKLIEQNPNGCGSVLFGGTGNMWCTNRVQNSASVFAPTFGILNQVWVGLNDNPGAIPTYVVDTAAGPTREQAIDGFRYNLGLSARYYPQSQYFKSNVFYAPLDPATPIYVTSSWAANDPLVHYTMGDLGRTNTVNFQRENPDLPNVGLLNVRYGPWGKGPESMQYDLSLKDPLVQRSDDWNFPTNKLPNIGWLGRIHRGTPWQTVYLKSADVNQVDTNRWPEWTGNHTTWDYFTNRVFDADISRPVNDRRLFGLFTTALNENSGHGKLSVNQTNLAAWSAVLSGVGVITNTVGDSDWVADPFRTPEFERFIIPPAGGYDLATPAAAPGIVKIVRAMNQYRLTNGYHGVFTNMGDFLGVPELTLASPFINRGAGSNAVPSQAAVNIPGLGPVTYQVQKGITDEVYERIPQQILSLLNLGEEPRFAIYSFGQTLHPADHSILPGGDYQGVCTNYQVTAETATRTVVRVVGSPDPSDIGLDVPVAKRYPPRLIIESYNVLPPE